MKASDFFKHINYYSFSVDQISKLNVDEMIVGDIGAKTLVEFRMCIGRYSTETGKSFKTKMVNGNLHIGRIR